MRKLSMITSRWSSIVTVAGSLIFFADGCTFGPSTLRISQTKYNMAIQSTTNEQLLLNLVRLRYRDVPLFLQIPSVSTQSEITQSSDFSAAITENVGPEPLNADLFNLGFRLEFSERPTVTIIPLQGNDFVTRMFKTYDLDTIATLHASGWAIDRIIGLTVNRMNHLGNAVNASSPTPDEAPVYADFTRVMYLLRQLQNRDGFILAYSLHEENASDPLPETAVTTESALAAAGKGYFLRRTEDGYVLRTTHPVLQLRPSAETRRWPEWIEFRDLLNLEPGLAEYEITLAAVPASYGVPNGRDKQIIINTRSLLGTLFYLSHAVEVPPQHLVNGLATITRDESGREINWADVTNNLLRIRTQPNRPTNAAAAVKYRGNWFYIEDDDRNSKSTFMLLNYLVAWQAGEYETRGPVLTLPVGR